MASNLKEFASRAGVSVVTASRALNDDRRVKPDTRQRLKALAHQIGYRPNAAARALSKSRNNNVGLMIATGGPASGHGMASGTVLRDYSDFVPLLCEELETAGLNLMLAMLSEIVVPGGVDPRLPMMFEESHVSSLVVLNFVSVQLGDLVRQMDLFTIAVDGPSAGTPSIQRDECAAAEGAAEHLVQLGHKRIAYWGYDLITTPVVRHDMFPQGYLKAMARHRLLPVPGWDQCVGGEEVVDFYLGLPEPPTAVIAFDDERAGGLVCRLMSRGLSVPGDVSVIGLRGLGYASTFFPKITVIGTPFDQMAGQTLRWLSDESSRPGEGDPLTVWLPPQLRSGGSTGPVATRGGAAKRAGRTGPHVNKEKLRSGGAEVPILENSASLQP